MKKNTFIISLLTIDKIIKTYQLDRLKLDFFHFFQGKLFRSPLDNSTGDNTDFFGIFKGDECDPAGCFYELTFSLMIIMVGKQFLNNFIEIALP